MPETTLFALVSAVADTRRCPSRRIRETMTNEVSMRQHRTAHVTVVQVAVFTIWITTAVPSAADPGSPLGQAVTAARSASACPSLQSDPRVERVAQMANQATSDYIAHRSAAVPFTDPLPALSTVGYPGSKGLVLAGYGVTEANALHGLMLEWQAFKPDCSYTQFGSSTLRDGGGFNLASVVLATPALPGQ